MSMNIHGLPKMNRWGGGAARGRGLKNDMKCEHSIWAACGGVAKQSKVSKAGNKHTTLGATLLQVIYSTGTARVCPN